MVRKLFYQSLLWLVSLFQGTELIGITAGEAKDPEKSVPKAINQVFWRILLFYIMAIFVISALVYYRDPRLLSASTQNIAESPFTMSLKMRGLPLRQV